MSTGQQVILAVLLILGNPILVSIFTLAFRKHVFEKRFQDIIRADRERSMKPTGAVVGMAGAMFGLPVMSNFRSFNKAEPKPSRTPIQARSSPQILGGVGSHLQATSPEIRISMTNDAGQGLDLEAGKGPFLAPPSSSPGLANGSTPELPMSPGSRSIAFLDPIREGATHEHPTGLGVQHTSPNPSHGSSHEQISHRKSAASSSHENRTPVHLQRPEQGFNINSFLRQNRAQIGRNGQFFNLTAQEREYLGGVEYRALKLLIAAVTCYFVLIQALGALALGAWIAVHETDATQTNSQNPWWTGIFLAVSAFNNGGICLLDAGISAFLSSYFLLVVVTCLMLAGSAAFPAFLRLGLWLLAQGLKYGTREAEYPVLKETLNFTLKYPRRVYTLLFPSRSTWYLVAMLVGFVAVDWVLILVLSLGNAVLTSIPVGQRVFDVLFQSISIWSGGFAALSPASVYVDLQVLWMVIMYLETYPQTITMRNSNVYEERSLGIYAGDEPGQDGEDKESGGEHATATLLSVPPRAHADAPLSPMSALSRTSQVSIRRLADVGRRSTAFMGRQIQQRIGGFQGVGVSAPRRSEHRPFPTSDKSSSHIFAGITSPSLQSQTSSGTYRSVTTKHEAQVDLVSQQVRSQLSHDVWWMALALFVITLIETKHTLLDPSTFNAFSILFEVVSAYTNIGLSIGLPNAAYSLSGGFYTGSKIVMVLVMLRGRHRGLPVALDRAVRLPKEKLDDMEEEDAEIRRAISQEASMRSRAVSRKTSFEVPPA